MNKKGFTLIELLAVIALLGLIIGIAVPGITRASTNAKKKTLSAKIKNIEKTAVLYSYDGIHKINGVEQKGSFNIKDKDDGNASSNYCYNIDNCFYYKINNSDTITVNDLITEGYLKPDDDSFYTSGMITDPTGTYDNLNKCKIQIYKKYKKVYAVLDRDSCDE